VFDSVRHLMRTNRSPLFEIARVFVCFDHIDRSIVNVDRFFRLVQTLAIAESRGGAAADSFQVLRKNLV
jgi:hypothetical protein